MRWLLIFALILLISSKSFRKFVGGIITIGVLIGIVVLLTSHPFLCIGGFIVLCFIIGSKNDKREKSQQQYQQYNQRRNTSNSNSQRQQNQQTRQRTTHSYFAGCYNKEQLKKRHRDLSMKLHPDKGGNAEEFKRMQAEYDSIKRRYR